jgi:hypothetical protein
MPKRVSLLLSTLAAFIAVAPSAFSGTEAGLKLLKDLRQGLDSAQALRSGSRVSLPTQDLSRLIGVHRSDVESTLGLPTYCGHDESWSNVGTNCGTATPWSYRWGPPPPRLDSAGPGRIVVTAGGPPLLVLEFSSDKVTAPRWQEER